MSRKAFRQGLPLIIAEILILPTILFAQKGLSHVRVVRLSYVSGTVAVKRPASTEWAKALVNTPIQEGFEVSTSAKSYAEVEFENGSTARLGEFSKVSFDQLAIDESGNKLNRLTFEQGYATFHFLPEHHDAYDVKIADAVLTPNGKSEFRTDLERSRVRVEVFSGSVEVATATQSVKLGKDKVLEFDPQATEVALNTTQGISKDSWDKWTSARDTQSQLSLADQGGPTRGPAYGMSDLNAYGAWGNFPGFGYGWSPFVSAGWSPYSMGMWSWYPGMGYTWIGGEPWGWLPYHYGNWNFTSGFGWFWMPGNFDASWSPALVSWYSGAGWLGWAPLGVLGGPGQNIVTTAPGGFVQNGMAINPQIVGHVPVTAGTRITRMPFEPGAGAMLSGPRLTATADEMFTPRAASTHTMAPASILMGGDGEKEGLQSQHSSHEPLRAHMGTTLGGHYSVGGTAGEFRGSAFSGTNGARGSWQANGPRGPDFSRSGGPGGPGFSPQAQQPSAFPQNGAGQTTPSAASGSSSAPSSASSAGAGHAASPSPGPAHH